MALLTAVIIYLFIRLFVKDFYKFVALILFLFVQVLTVVIAIRKYDSAKELGAFIFILFVLLVTEVFLTRFRVVKDAI